MSTPRIETLLHDPERQSAYERWGERGRPVLLLNPSPHDRSAWWPVAARLGDDHAVMVLDLPPGHSPAVLADDLAHMVHQMGTRAPVLVGHAAAALVASVFAARYLAHAVVNVEQRLDRTSDDATANDPASDRSALDDTGLDQALREITDPRKPVGCPYLSVFATAPEPGYAEWLAARLPRARCRSYGVPGPFPHLADPARFTADVRDLAA